MPPAMILQIEDERAKEVKDWNQREGVEAYLESTKDKGKVSCTFFLDLLHDELTLRQSRARARPRPRPRARAK